MSGHLNSFVYTVCLKGVDYMTKTKSIILCLVILIAIFSGCSTQETNSKSEVQANTINAITNEITAEQETSESETTTQKSDNSETTVANKARPAEQKSTGRTTTKKSTATQKQTTTQKQNSAQSQTTTRKVTTTQKQNVTQKQTTTKKETTTAKQNKLSKSDVDWVQSQAHSYIKSKGMSVNSSVESFSYRISSGNYADRNKLLSNLKDTIDYEYSECMSSGWKNVDMYVSVTSDGDGDYWLVVMYG